MSRPTHYQRLRVAADVAIPFDGRQSSVALHHFFGAMLATKKVNGDVVAAIERAVEWAKAQKETAQ